MTYGLFHKDEKVLTVDYEPDTNRFGKILEVNNESHIPVGLENIEGCSLSQAVQFWWESRILPKNRSNYKNNFLEIETLLAASCGFNLSDQYWIKPEDSDICWKDYNFFRNDFNEKIGKYLIEGKTDKIRNMNSNTPDLFSNGEQDKRWVIDKGVRKLIKYGRPPYYEQPFNEMLATEICRRLNFPHVSYSALIRGDRIFSSCPCFVDEDTEFVPAGFVQYAEKKQKGDSAFNHLISCCKKLGMSDLEKIEEGICQTVLLDYITANVDRHFGNFGFIRDAVTLEWEGLSPVFDTGNAMFFESPTSDLRKSSSLMDNVKCKSFADTQKKQLERFSSRISRLGIDFSRLDGISKYYDDILSLNPKVDEERRKILTGLLAERIERAKEIIYSRNPVVKDFLSDIACYSGDNFLMHMKETMFLYQKKGEAEGKAVENYLLSLKPKDEKELVSLIKKDIAREGRRKDRSGSGRGL